jgi:2-phosphoglycerate kinase
MSLPLLIGGSPRSGKSTVAKQLAAEFSILQISTDKLREDFRLSHIGESKQYSWIFCSQDMTAEEFWCERTPEQVMHVEIEQGRELWPFLQQNIESGTYGIIEGVSLLPKLIRQTYADRIRAVFLIDTNRERIEKIIMAEGLWDHANTYSDRIKPKELEWVMLHNQWLRGQAEQYDYPVIDRNEHHDAEILELVRQLRTGG